MARGKVFRGASLAPLAWGFRPSRSRSEARLASITEASKGAESGVRTPWNDRGPSSPHRGAIISLSWGRGKGWGRTFRSTLLPQAPRPRRRVRSAEAGKRALRQAGGARLARRRSRGVLLASPSPGRADEFERCLGFWIALAGGFESAAVCFLQGSPIRRGVLVGKLHPLDSHLQQPRGRFLVGTAGRQLFCFGDRLPKVCGFSRPGLGRTVSGLRSPIDWWRRCWRRGRRVGRFAVATGKRQATKQGNHEVHGKPPFAFAHALEPWTHPNPSQEGSSNDWPVSLLGGVRGELVGGWFI